MDEHIICNILTNDNTIRQKLNLLIEKASQENIEYGVDICLNDNILVTDTTKGTRDIWRREKISNCPKGTREVVGFHTHWSSSIYERIPSGRDYISSALRKEKKLCIGYTLGKNMVDCYKIPDDIRETVDDYDLTYKKYFSTGEGYSKMKIISNKVGKIRSMGLVEALDYADNNRLCEIPLNKKKDKIY